MDNIQDVVCSISVGIVIAYFLLNTGRGLKAIELCREILILLNIKEMEKLHVKMVKMKIYQAMFNAYCP